MIDEDSVKTPHSSTMRLSIKRKGQNYATGVLVNKRWIVSIAREFKYLN